MKKLLCALLAMSLLLCFSLASAKKYSASPAGQGTSTVGIGGDYANLGEACMDFNTTANTGNWTIEILSDLTEPSNIAFGNTVSTNTVLIKPAAGVTATVTFSTTTDNSGPSGSFIVGSNTIDSYTLFTVNNFIIDGSNNGTDSRDLTFQSVPGYIGYMYLIRPLGKCEGFTIKNCNLLALGGTASSCYGVYPTTRKVGTEVLRPDNSKIINNYIVCSSNWAGQGIGYGIGGAAAGDTTAQNIEISGNTIIARTRGIFLNGVQSGVIKNNTIQINQPTTGYSSYGIWHYSCNGVPGFSLDVYGNKIDSLVSGNVTGGAYGLTAIDLGSGSGTFVNGTYNIYNNMVCGFNYSGATTVIASNILYRGISCSNATTVTYNIFNNSVNMPLIANLAAESTNYCFGIGFPSSTFAGTANIKNNIVRNAQTNGADFYCNSTIATIVSDYNDYYPATGVSFAQLGSPNIYATLAAWTAATGLDLNSQSVDPMATAPNAWKTATDLHFNGTNAAPLTSGTPITTPFAITTDIDNQLRSATAPWKGADEAFDPLVVDPYAINVAPGSAAVTVTVSGGQAPYTWSLSTSALGTLNTTSGATVSFTPGSVNISGTLTVSDNVGQSASIEVVITPTAAPLAKE
jgi:hypothetical protein